MHQFPKRFLAWNSTCFGQFLCASLRVYSLYIRRWYISYRFVDSFRAGPGWNCSSFLALLESYLQTCMTMLSVQWINSWWWAEKLPETCGVSQIYLGNSTCFGQFLCPSSAVYSMYIRRWYISYRFVDSFRAGPGWNCSSFLALLESCLQTCMTMLSVQWINSWWWAEELPETCGVSQINLGN